MQMINAPRAAALNDPLVLHPGADRTILFGVKLGFDPDGQRVEDAWSLDQCIIPSHFAGAAPHAHQQTDEAYYVLEGAPTFQIGEQRIDAEPGAFVYVPRGVVHTYYNAALKPATLLVFTSPAAVERCGYDTAEVLPGAV